jgi:hypothetical protein
MAAAFFAPPRIRREKAGSCRMKKTRRSFAFGSPQRNRMTLMFGAARFWRPGLSASRAKGFRVTPRGIGATPWSPMLHKCLHLRRIFDSATLRASPCGSSI